MAKPNREPDFSAERADGQMLMIWLHEIQSRVEWKDRQDNGKSRYRVIIYVDDTAMPIGTVFSGREAAEAFARPLIESASKR
jgi:hypothetical protein